MVYILCNVTLIGGYIAPHEKNDSEDFSSLAFVTLYAIGTEIS